MSSKAQRNAGYRLPVEIDGYDLLCVELKIPNNLEYIAAFTAQMWDLATWFNWEKSYQPGDTRATEAAQYWNYLIDTYLCIRFNQPVEDTGMACCDDDNELGRYGGDGIWETSTDGGTTWEDDPDDDPRNTYIGAPPLPGAPGNSIKCAAADNVRDLFTQYRDSLMDMLEAGTPLIALIAGILAFIAAITGVSGIAIGLSVLMLSLASALLTLTPESVETQINETVLEEFKCLVYCRLEPNGQITYDNWVGLLGDIATTFTGFPETFFYSTVSGMGYIGISNAGTIGVATATDCGSCGCDPICESADAFYNGTVTGQVDNGDGTVTFTVNSAPNVGGVHFIGWGDRENAESPCCTFMALVVVGGGGGAPGGAVQLCGSGTEIPTFPTGGNCYHFWLYYNDGALTTPFTAEITVAAECE